MQEVWDMVSEFLEGLNVVNLTFERGSGRGMVKHAQRLPQAFGRCFHHIQHIK